MQGVDIIERAFQLAAESGSVCAPSDAAEDCAPTGIVAAVRTKQIICAAIRMSLVPSLLANCRQCNNCSLQR